MANAHILPGEYTYDGMTMCQSYRKEVLDKIRDSELQDGDVLIATYAKCGERIKNKNTIIHCSAF